LDLADEKHMIADGNPRMVAAFQPGDASVDQRRGGVAELIGHAGKAVGVRPRESPRDIDLVVGKHVDRIAGRLLEARKAARPAAETPDDQRRIERYRVE